jgi:predicted CoA-binding protein
MNAIDRFLSEKVFGVAGASRDRSKYGNMVLRALLQAGYQPIPIHPRESEIEGLKTYPDLDSAPRIASLAIITPPSVTEKIVEDAIRTGVKHLWMQPGAESTIAVNLATAAGLTVVSGGPCLLVKLSFRDNLHPESRIED